MINDARGVLSGYVARDPRFRITASGISNVSLPVAYTPRRVDKGDRRVDGRDDLVRQRGLLADAGRQRRAVPAQGRAGAGQGASYRSGRTRRTGFRGWRSRSRRPPSGTTWPAGSRASSGRAGCWPARPQVTATGRRPRPAAGRWPRPRWVRVRWLRPAWTVPARRWPRSIAPTEPIRARVRWTGLASPRQCPRRSEAARRDPRNCLPGRLLGSTLFTQRHSSAAS